MSNKGFADTVVSGDASKGRSPPRAGILEGRTNGLARLASGSLITRQHELVDPARCRIWDGHNRDYESLDIATCADLLESLKAQRQQEVPAIVRRVVGDPAYDYEVICGARRHWSITWLRSHDFPEFRFLIEPRELSDEEAFRLADLENRHRKDLSDYERAKDYARAIERYYGGSQQRMVERLEVTKSWLSRYLELARLPEDVIKAFGNPHALGIKHAAVLAPLLRATLSRDRILAEARAITEERGSTAEPTSVAAVVRRLVSAASASVQRKASSPMITVRGQGNEVIVQGRQGRAGRLDLTVIPGSQWEPQRILIALSDLLDQLQSTKTATRRTSRRQQGP